MSERRACKAIGCFRMTMRYQMTRTDDAGLRQRLRAIAQEYRRFGHRRLQVLLERQDYVNNHKKLFRLYREEKLAVRRRRQLQAGDRKPGAHDAADGAERLLVARLRIGSAHRRSPLPYAHRGQRLHPRVPGAGGRHLALGHPGGTGIGLADDERGKPKKVANDNGSEFKSNAILTWTDQSRVAWRFIAAGKPMQNAFIESLNRGLHDELLNNAVHVAGPGPRRARMLAGGLQEARPHSQLGWKMPCGFVSPATRAGS